jgi:hypothetical protein
MGSTMMMMPQQQQWMMDCWQTRRQASFQSTVMGMRNRYYGGLNFSPNNERGHPSRRLLLGFRFKDLTFEIIMASASISPVTALDKMDTEVAIVGTREYLRGIRQVL